MTGGRLRADGRKHGDPTAGRTPQQGDPTVIYGWPAAVVYGWPAAAVCGWPGVVCGCLAPGSPSRTVVEVRWVGSGSCARWPGFDPFGRLRDPGPAVLLRRRTQDCRPRRHSAQFHKKREMRHTGTGGRVRARARKRCWCRVR